MTIGTMSTARETTCCTSSEYFILEGKEIVKVCRQAWALWMRMACPVIASESTDTHKIQTRFTGVKDSSGCLFQSTAIRHRRPMDHFDEPTVDFAATWMTYDEAMRGHRLLCKL